MSQADRPGFAWDGRTEDGDELRFEVIDGRCVALPPTWVRPAALITRLVQQMGEHARLHRLGFVLPYLLFQLFRGRDRMRRPDVAFVSHDRWPRGKPLPSTEEWAVVPDLVVEVVGPNTPAADLVGRLHDLFRAGTRRAWVLFPDAGQVYDYRSPGRVVILGPDEILDGEEVFPGHRMTLQGLLRAAMLDPVEDDGQGRSR